MKPAPFDYVRVDDLDHAAELLAVEGDAAKVIAGGQSLVPVLRMRLATPALLVDIGRVRDLRYTTGEGGVVRIGALTRHADVEDGPVGAAARKALPVLGESARYIGHHPIRARGTFGGSIAHADAAAEWCLLARLCDAVVVARSTRGTREIPCANYFTGFLSSSLQADELVVAVTFPYVPNVAKLVEFSRRHGDFAVVASAVALDTDGPRCTSARIALGGVDSVPVRVPDAERVLTGSALCDEAFREAADLVRRAVEPPTDIHGSGDYRRQLAATLTERALRAACSDLRGEGHRWLTGN